MRVGYLLNSYPMTSTTFIRREIEALERRGVEVVRYAVRPWETALVDPLDIAEQARTHYLLPGNARPLGAALLRAALGTPGFWGAALPAWWRIAQDTDGTVRALAYLAEAAYLRARTEADGIRHLHVHFATNATTVAMLCRLLGGPTYSFMAHGPDEFVNPGAVHFPLKLEHAAFALGITHFARMQLILHGGIAYRERIGVARCGLYLPDFVADPSPPQNKTFVCVGRLCPQKGQTLIPEAVVPLVKDHPDLKIVLIGDGETRPMIEAEIARLGLGAHFELTGWMDNAQVRARIAAARALLLPSFAEGLPIVIMEAMALRRPVISTYIAGIPELLDAQCGWIVPGSSMADLRAAMADALAASPARLAAMGAEARRRIEAHHDIEGLAALLESKFAPLLTSGNTVRA